MFSSLKLQMIKEKFLKLSKFLLSQIMKNFYQDSKGPAVKPMKKVCLDRGASYLEGLPFCKHSQHPQSW